MHAGIHAYSTHAHTYTHTHTHTHTHTLTQTHTQTFFCSLRDPLLNLSSLIMPSQPLIWKAGHHYKSRALSDEIHTTITVNTKPSQEEKEGWEEERGVGKECVMERRRGRAGVREAWRLGVERERGEEERTGVRQGRGEGEGKNEFGCDIKADHTRLVISQSTWLGVRRMERERERSKERNMRAQRKYRGV